MKTSIALAAFNGERYLPAQLESFVNQSQLPDELIISDDKSTDQTLVVCRAFAARAPFEVVILNNGTNVGLSRNFERAMEACSGDIVLLSDQDDVWHQDKILRLVEILGSHPTVGLVIHDIDLASSDLTPVGQTKMQRLRESGFTFERDYVNGMATAVRRSLLECCLPFPRTKLQSGYQMTHDYWLHRCAAAIGSKLVVEDVLTTYRLHGDNLTASSPLNDLSASYVSRRNHGRSLAARLRVDMLATQSGLAATLARVDMIRNWIAKGGQAAVAQGLGEAHVLFSKRHELDMRRAALEYRIAVLALPRWRRIGPVVSAFIYGRYRYFAGLSSAIKDLLL